MSFYWALKPLRVPSGLWLYGSICVGFKLWTCGGCGVFPFTPWWQGESRGRWRCDWGVIVGHKQDSWDSMCRHFFSCSLWFPFWRTEYLTESGGRGEERENNHFSYLSSKNSKFSEMWRFAALLYIILNTLNTFWFGAVGQSSNRSAF